MKVLKYEIKIDFPAGFFDLTASQYKFCASFSYLTLLKKTFHGNCSQLILASHRTTGPDVAENCWWVEFHKIMCCGSMTFQGDLLMRLPLMSCSSDMVCPQGSMNDAGQTSHAQVAEVEIWSYSSTATWLHLKDIKTIIIIRVTDSSSAACWVWLKS